mgnify:CR=1 FL=1
MKCRLLAAFHPRGGGDPEIKDILDSRQRGNDNKDFLHFKSISRKLNRACCLSDLQKRAFY